MHYHLAYIPLPHHKSCGAATSEYISEFPHRGDMTPGKCLRRCDHTEFFMLQVSWRMAKNKMLFCNFKLNQLQFYYFLFFWLLHSQERRLLQMRGHRFHRHELGGQVCWTLWFRLYGRFATKMRRIWPYHYIFKWVVP